jgi:histidine triad (HIT) family protein
MLNDCLFCKIVAKQIPASVITETDDLLVIKDIAPKAPIHYLVLPKKHYADLRALTESDRSLASNVLLMLQKLSADLPGNPGFKLVVNNGKDAGQHVFHLHFHFLVGSVAPGL